MISPRDKGIKGSVPKRVRNYNGIDLSTLPKILSFKAAVAHNEIVLKHTLVAVLILWGIQFSVDQYNDLEMAREYRKKEFLLAPSEITGITPVKPSLVPATYVDDISSIYLSLLGNINALNIEENYAKLVKHMSDSLRMKFQAETSEWIETVKSENISEVLKSLVKSTSIVQVEFTESQLLQKESSTPDITTRVLRKRKLSLF